jgi:hypothetical protein
MVVGKVLRSRRHMSTHNFEFGCKKYFPEINKDIYVAVKEWKLQHVNVVTFHSKLILRHEYSHWRDVSERNASKGIIFFIWCIVSFINWDK